MAEARYSHGMILRHRVSDAGSYFTVAEVRDQSVPSPTRQKILTTPHSAKSQTSIAGRLIEYSDLTFTINYLPATEETQRNIFSGIDPDGGNGRIDGWQIETPDGETWSFKGWLMTFDVQTPMDDVITGDITVAVTGVVSQSFRGVAVLDSYAPTDGDTLNVSITDPDGIKTGTTPTYQWQRKVGRNDWTDIGSSTGDSYDVESANSGEDDWKALLRCKVTYTDVIRDEAVVVYTPATAPAVA